VLSVKVGTPSAVLDVHNKVLILGHRGAAELPENTIPSFEKALKSGAHGFELDVRQTADHKLVVVHGAVVGSKSVPASNYEEIRGLENGFEVPLLEEVLKKFAPKAFLDIELKAPGFEQAAVDLIRAHGDPERTVISAFDTDTLIKVQDLFPELQLGYIYNRTQDEEARHNCPIEVVIPQFRLASRELISEVHEEGLKVFAWTVNEENEIERLLDLGVDGIITDYPERVAGVLSRNSRKKA
jgi:glycerophosphoryl diester phosphodiesterase